MKCKLLSIVLTIGIMLSLIPVFSVSAESAIHIGDYVQMGKYYDEVILWRCVDIDENGPLMLADKILTIKGFDAAGVHQYLDGTLQTDRSNLRKNCGSNLWETSNIRSWLNSTLAEGSVAWPDWCPPMVNKVAGNPYDTEKGFLADFTLSEQNAIKSVTQKSLLNSIDVAKLSSGGTAIHKYSRNISTVTQNYDAAYYQNVTDKMFLLDVKQVNMVYLNSVTLGENYWIGMPTEAAVLHSEFQDSALSSLNYWNTWLRTPQTDNYIPDNVRAIVNNTVDSKIAYEDSLGVRPAFYMDTEAVLLQSGNGSIEEPYVASTQSSVTGVSLNKDTTAIDVGNTETLIASFIPPYATNKNVLWTSSDETIAQVDDMGVVTALKAGVADITATTVEGGFSAKCTVTVVSVIVDKTALIAAIADATTLITGRSVGNASGNVSQTALDDYQAVITNATAVKDDENATRTQVNTQLSILAAATIAFYDAIIDTAKLTLDIVGTTPKKVGDIFRVAMNLSQMKSGTFYSADAAIYFDPTKLQVVKADGTPTTAATLGFVKTITTDFGAVGAFIDNTNGFARYAIYIQPDASDPDTGDLYNLTGYPVSNKTLEMVDIRFKVIATGDTKLQLAKEGKAPNFMSGFSEGAMGYFGSKTELGTVIYNYVPLLVLPVDKLALQTAITNATTLLNSKTVGMYNGNVPQAAYDAFWEVAIIPAIAVYNDSNATQSEVDAQVTALSAATTAFINAIIVINKTALNTLITNATVLMNSKTVGTLNGNVPQSARDALGAAISQATVVKNNANVTQAQVDAQVTALGTAMTAFNNAVIAPIETDKTVLVNAIINASSLVISRKVGAANGNVPQSAKDALQLAITEAVAVKNNMGATQEQVDAKVTALSTASTAYTNSIVSVNKAALITLITNANTLLNSKTVGNLPGNVPQYAKTDLQAAITGASAVRISLSATQAQVDEQVDALAMAIELFNDAIIVVINKEILSSAILSATTLITSKTVGVENGNVPQSANNAFQTAITNASAVMLNSKATQAQVNAQVAALGLATTTFNNSVIVILKYELTGTVKLLAGANLTKVSVVAKQEGVIVDTVSVLANGTFEISLKPGVYTFEISRTGYIKKIFTDFTVTTESTQVLSSETIQLVAGDVLTVTQNTINTQDLQTILSNFGSTIYDASFNPTYDLNDDGRINMLDLQAVLKNFGKVQ